MLTYTSKAETEPPQSPGRVERLIPSIGMPSRHQDTLAGGLLELESQISLARTPGTRFLGSTLIFTVSGGTKLGIENLFKMKIKIITMSSTSS